MFLENSLAMFCPLLRLTELGRELLFFCTHFDLLFKGCHCAPPLFYTENGLVPNLSRAAVCATEGARTNRSSASRTVLHPDGHISDIRLRVSGPRIVWCSLIRATAVFAAPAARTNVWILRLNSAPSAVCTRARTYNVGLILTIF